MSRSHRRAAASPAPKPTTEAHSSVTAENEEEQRNLQAVAAYLRVLQEWSVEAQLEGLGGDQGVVSGAAPKIRKRR